MRKMKLGIYTRRIRAVFGGFARPEATGRRGDEKEKAHIAHPQGKNRLSRSPSGAPDKAIIALH
ncbi:hypothetical protein [Thermus filiformis]|uniref:hypothetical protein n=1 Tax=Thermus filiformis TaxID=276 RepID=UPI0005316AE4|nr:hypothetical protein [Thermus filiformis]